MLIPVTASAHPSGTEFNERPAVAVPVNLTVVPSAISGGATGASFIWFISFI